MKNRRCVCIRLEYEFCVIFDVPQIFQLAGIPILVLGNKRDLPGALDENGLIEKMNLNAIQDREICCYSVSCKEKDNIDITLQWLISHSKSGGGN